MLTLLRADDILKLGLTATQVFYLVGKQATKKLCRFVKTDSIKTAISTLLSIKGIRSRVEDIRLTDFGGLKVWTDQGIQTIASLEARVFLTRYNQLALNGCNSECKCAEDPDNLWKQFCVHKIAEHLQGVKEKVEAIASVAKEIATPDFTQIKVQRLANEVMHAAMSKGLVVFPFEEDGDRFFKICRDDKTELGHIIVTADAQLRILSVLPGSREIAVGAVASAIARLDGAFAPPQEGARSGFSWTKAGE